MSGIYTDCHLNDKYNALEQSPYSKAFYHYNTVLNTIVKTIYNIVINLFQI